MPRRYRPREVIRVLERLGWVRVRQRGSHVRLALPDGTFPVTVPVSDREVDAGTFRRILRQAHLTPMEFHRGAEEIL
jgi:predicted RNA binding protein YcfA (HicA-like mRNA interferase family)